MCLSQLLHLSRKLAIMREVKSSIVLLFRQCQVPFMWGAYFGVVAGVYKCNVVQKDAYIYSSNLLWMPIILSLWEVALCK